MEKEKGRDEMISSTYCGWMRETKDGKSKRDKGEGGGCGGCSRFGPVGPGWRQKHVCTLTFHV